MFYKLALLILTVAAASAAQLSIRHQRLQAVHEMTSAINEEADLNRRFQSLRVRVARAVTPSQILAAGEARWELAPMGVDWSSEPALAFGGDEELLSDEGSGAWGGGMYGPQMPVLGSVVGFEMYTGLDFVPGELSGVGADVE